MKALVRALLTRLAHVVVFPITHLARRLQIVIWNRSQGRGAASERG